MQYEILTYEFNFVGMCNKNIIKYTVNLIINNIGFIL